MGMITLHTARGDLAAYDVALKAIGGEYARLNLPEQHCA
jgi:hypothetical protein